MPDIQKDTHIAASLAAVWAALATPEGIEAWMGADSGVVMELEPGGRCEFFFGETTGHVTLARAPAELAYTWRQADWDDGWADSVVRWTLSDADGGTRLQLTHDNFPNDSERDGHDEGWEMYWLQPMKAHLEAGD